MSVSDILHRHTSVRYVRGQSDGVTSLGPGVVISMNDRDEMLDCLDAGIYCVSVARNLLAPTNRAGAAASLAILVPLARKADRVALEEALRHAAER